MTANPDGLPVATHQGYLDFGPFRLKCWQLDDGRRILDADDIQRLFGERDESP